MWQHQSPPLREARLGPRGSARAHLGREARFGAKEHVAAVELSFQGGRAQSHGTCGSVGDHLGREARSGAEEHVEVSELNSAPEPRNTCRGVWLATKLNFDLTHMVFRCLFLFLGCLGRIFLLTLS
jgi:hypothetical protein